MSSVHSPFALAVVAVALTLVLPVPLTAQSDPRAPDAIELPLFGTIEGTIRDLARFGHREEFGRAVSAVGDLSGDGLADWVIEHDLADTVIEGSSPTELLLFCGVRGALPPRSAGRRIGPDELGTRTRFLAAGDFDGDTHRDIAVSIELLGDTSEGNPRPGMGAYQLRRIAVFWGNGAGVFNTSDTTRLGNPYEIWMSGFLALAVDMRGDGTTDLVLWGKGTFRSGGQIPTPWMHIFQGERGRRWGRRGVPRTAAWQWWDPPKFNMLRTRDHDGDGAADLVLIRNDDANGPVSGIAVLYGRRGELPDTTELELLETTSRSINQLLLIDVTGDRIGELIAASGDSAIVYVYLGLRGQRLLAQYGSGHDPPRPGQEAWWGRPWAEIWSPGLIASGWGAVGFRPLYDLGDVGLDGVGDICANYKWSTILCYNGGRILDSLIDAWIVVPGWGPSDVGAVSVLGDIDGSDISTIAIGFILVPTGSQNYPGGVMFVKSSHSVPRYGRPRLLPPGTDHPSGVVAPAAEGVTGWLHEGWLHARWSSPRFNSASLYALDGRLAGHWPIAEGLRRLDVSLEGMAAGNYVLVLHGDVGVAAMRIVVCR